MSVVEPKVGLCSPRFNCQPTAQADEDDEQIRFEIGAGDDRDGYEPENADQEPIDVVPPFAIPIYIGKIFLCQRPPDVDDEKNSKEEPAQQDTAVAGPEFRDGSAGGDAKP